MIDLAQGVQLRPFKFEVKAIELEPKHYVGLRSTRQGLKIMAEVLCRDTGRPRDIVFGGQLDLLALTSSIDYLPRTLRAFMQSMLTHEIDECILVDGHCFRDPHR